MVDQSVFVLYGSLLCFICFFFFFFQAEDGIRDKLVTGVQMCALPISFPVALNSMALMSRTSKWWAMPLSSLKVIVWAVPSKYVPLYRVPSRRVTVSLQPGIVNARDRKSVV